MPLSKSQRVVFYIDGFNFYYGLREKNWKQFYWLDITNFCRSLIKPSHTLVNVNYFSALPLNHSGKVRRQDKFFKANSINQEFVLHLSEHKPKNKICNQCGHTIISSEEKQTDVKIACEILKNCSKNICDLSIIISGDSDLIPAIRSAKEINRRHQVMVFFPPNRITHEIKNYVDGFRDLSQYKKKFNENKFPDIIRVNNTDVQIPEKWKNYQV